MKAIIFDCDGTLVDTEHLHYQAWVLAVKKYNIEISLEEYSTFVGQPIEKTAQQIAKRIGKDCKDELKDSKLSHYFAMIERGVAPIESTLAFLQKLIDVNAKQKRFKLGIASGASRHEIFTYLKHLGIDGAFDAVLSGKDDLDHIQDSEGTNKPKPYIYQEAAKRLGLKPEECIAIEDSHPGVVSSHRAGCFTVAVPTPFSMHHDFSLSHLKLTSFSHYSVDSFLAQVKDLALKA